MAVITVANYKTFKGISASTYDAILATIIAGAQSRAERFCGRLFDTATFTEKYSGNGSEILLLKNFPITSITSITERDRGAYASTEYTFDADSGEVRLLGTSEGRFPADEYGEVGANQFGVSPCFPVGFRNLTVVYVGAYGSGATAVPADLTLAMLQFVDYLFAPVKDGAIPDTSLKSETLGDYSYTRGDASEQVGIENAMLAKLFGQFRRGVP